MRIYEFSDSGPYSEWMALDDDAATLKVRNGFGEWTTVIVVPDETWTAYLAALRAVDEFEAIFAAGGTS